MTKTPDFTKLNYDDISFDAPSYADALGTPRADATDPTTLSVGQQQRLALVRALLLAAAGVDSFDGFDYRDLVRQYATTRAEYMKAEIIAPDDCGVLFNLGLMHYYLGEIDVAIESHRKAVQMEPKDHLKRSNLGDALWVAGRHEEALTSYRQARSLALAALDVNPGDANIKMDLAWISAMLGEIDAARRLIDSAREQSPDDPYLDFINALIWQSSGDSDKALVAVRDAIDKGYSRILIAAEPHLEELRQDPRFNELMSTSNDP